MKNASILVLLLAMLLHSPSASQAEIYNGNMLLEDCRQFLKFMEDKENESVVLSSTGYCLGYLQGQIDFQQYLQENTPSRMEHCFPVYTTLTDLAKVTVSYLEKNPGRLNSPAMEVSLAAFAESFPCDKISQTLK